MDVELFPKVFLSHHGALEVPAGEAVSPGGRPAHDVLGFGLFPDCKIVGGALVTLAVKAAGAFQRGLEGAAGKDAVVVVTVVFLHVEVDAAVGFVCVSGGENLLHGLNLLDDMAAGAGLYGGRLAAQKAHGLVIALSVVLDYLHRLQLLQTGFLCYLVFAFVGIVLKMAYVCDVTHIAHLVSQVLEKAEENVVGDAGTGMAKMGVSVHGGAADIHAHAAFVYGFEQLLVTGKGICQKQRFHK